MATSRKGTGSKTFAAKEKEEKEKRELLPKAQTEGKGEQTFESENKVLTDIVCGRAKSSFFFSNFIDSDSGYFVWLEIDLRPISSECSEEKRRASDCCTSR